MFACRLEGGHAIVYPGLAENVLFLKLVRIESIAHSVTHLPASRGSLAVGKEASNSSEGVAFVTRSGLTCKATSASKRDRREKSMVARAIGLLVSFPQNGKKYEHRDRRA